MTAEDKITVQFLGGLSPRTVKDDVTEIDAGAGTVRDLILSLQFQEHEVGTVLVNGKASLPDAALKAGDEVALFKPRG